MPERSLLGGAKEEVLVMKNYHQHKVFPVLFISGGGIPSILSPEKQILTALGKGICLMTPKGCWDCPE